MCYIIERRHRAPVLGRGVGILLVSLPKTQLPSVQDVVVGAAQQIPDRLAGQRRIESLKAKYPIHRAKLIGVEKPQDLMHSDITVGVASRFRHS